MKVAIYDRWLNALGGGEQVAFAYAQALRDFGYKTYLITHNKLDIKSAEKKMNVNLKNIQVVYIPFLPDYQLSGYFENYDILISNSYLDYVPNFSKNGILSIFFPSQVKASLYEYLRRLHLIPNLFNFQIYPLRYEDFMYDQHMNRHIYKYLGSNSKITLLADIRDIEIKVYFPSLAFSCLDTISFSFDGKKISTLSRLVNIHNNTATYKFNLGGKSKNKSLVIHMPQNEYSNGAALVSVYILGFRYILYNFLKTIIPILEMRVNGGFSSTKFADIESYHQIITISRFSQKWIEKYWGLSSNILYPPVEIKNFVPVKHKKNIIVHIGRFFVTGHSKKQLEMVQIFKQLVDDGVADWEFHLIGSIADGDIHQQYLDLVKEEAKGYPVYFHINANFSKLRQILSFAKIYWHTTGLDENPEKNPIRMEHFGITTVEAMASGVVPVVINLGGQSEIVIEGSGFLWNSREELLSYTKKLIDEPETLQQMSRNALERSKYFSMDNFKIVLRKLLNNNMQ